MGQKKKAKRFDDKLRKQGDRTLKALYSQYEKMADPSRSYFDQQIMRVQQDVKMIGFKNMEQWQLITLED